MSNNKCQAGGKTPTAYQAATVDHLLDIYKEHKAYIVADEVGMGKTIVAAELIKRGGYKRVVYIASNTQIAAQNAKELVTEAGLQSFHQLHPLAKGEKSSKATADRMSMLTHEGLDDKDAKYLISLSPAVTFTGKGSEGGTEDERKFYRKCFDAIYKAYKELHGLDAYNAMKTRMDELIAQAKQVKQLSDFRLIESIEKDEQEKPDRQPVFLEFIKLDKLIFALKNLEKKANMQKDETAKGLPVSAFNSPEEISPLRAYFTNACPPDLMDEFHTLLDPTGSEGGTEGERKFYRKHLNAICEDYLNDHGRDACIAMMNRLNELIAQAKKVKQLSDFRLIESIEKDEQDKPDKQPAFLELIKLKKLETALDNLEGKAKMREEERRKAAEMNIQPLLTPFNSPEEISPLRAYFNDSFLKAYQPDLIIMDEFHRFHTLLDPSGSSPGYNLWKNSDVQNRRCKLLLLSATPYQYRPARPLHTYTLYEDPEDPNETKKDDKPFQNFTELAGYLNKLNGRSSQDHGNYDIGQLYQHVLCRTQRNWLTGAVESSAAPVLYGAGDKAWIDSTRGHLDWLRNWSVRMDICGVQPLLKPNLEYMDEAPEYEQFLAGYKEAEDKQKAENQPALCQRLDNARENLALRLDDSKFNGEAFTDNLKGYYKWELLKQYAMPKGAELLLWVPPTMKRKAYAPELQDFSKTLVFGHYRMSTRAVSALTSMEAERRLREHLKENQVIIRFDIDDKLAEELFPNTLLEEAWAVSGSESLKNLKPEDLRAKVKNALTVFFNTTYARTVLTAWAVSSGIDLNFPRELLRKYCKEYHWPEMLREYLDVAGKEFLTCIAGYFPETGKRQNEELRPGVLLWTNDDWTKVKIMPDWTDTGFPCTFGERYIQDYSDKGAHDQQSEKGSMRSTAKRLDYIQSRFQSPFYPFVLAASETAREGVNLHNYCAQIIHWSVPSSDQAYTQEEGRVDRCFSLANRWQMADIYVEYEKDPACDSQHRGISTVGKLFEPAVAEEICKTVFPQEAPAIDRYVKSGIFPKWFLPGESHLKRRLFYQPLSTEELEYRQLQDTLRNYVTFGVPGVRDADLRGLCPYLVRQAL